MIDPSCADITARVLICLNRNGIRSDHPAMVAGVGFLTETQDEEGTWYGRWGCNYIYGTWLALQGLRAAGVPADDPRVRRGGAWLEAHQNPDGGWGETPGSYENPGLRGHGESTAAQTAWALLGLIADGPDHEEAIDRGIAYLLERQLDDGSWRDEPWTGTGFPCVFYLRYHLYATYFPLLALSAWARSCGGQGGPADR
jgi:squalene-hopene/tetraprenyl-beta-curcumene cyclase